MLLTFLQGWPWTPPSTVGPPWGNWFHTHLLMAGWDRLFILCVCESEWVSEWESEWGQCIFWYAVTDVCAFTNTMRIRDGSDRSRDEAPCFNQACGVWLKLLRWRVWGRTGPAERLITSKWWSTDYQSQHSTFFFFFFFSDFFCPIADQIHQFEKVRHFATDAAFSLLRHSVSRPPTLSDWLHVTSSSLSAPDSLNLQNN